MPQGKFSQGKLARARWACPVQKKAKPLSVSTESDLPWTLLE